MPERIRYRPELELGVEISWLDSHEDPSSASRPAHKASRKGRRHPAQLGVKACEGPSGDAGGNCRDALDDEACDSDQHWGSRWPTSAYGSRAGESRKVQSGRGARERHGRARRGLGGPGKSHPQVDRETQRNARRHCSRATSAGASSLTRVGSTLLPSAGLWEAAWEDRADKPSNPAQRRPTAGLVDVARRRVLAIACNHPQGLGAKWHFSYPVPDPQAFDVPIR